MKWIKDKTGRFSQRPFYEAQELDFECETLMTTFLQSKYGKVSFPLTTEDLTILIEQNTSDLDLYADLKEKETRLKG